MVSTIANDGVYTPPRIVAGELPPNAGPKPVVFHPPQQHRVISTMTAAQMKKMMEAVVLDGTARRAILDGYTIGGKTGTAQKVDPKTGAYSKTKYVASFVGFAPVNNPAITIAVILDSAQGLHQGGQVSAPVFKRIAQQVLEYMHVPHDIEPKNQQRFTLLVASPGTTTMPRKDPITSVRHWCRTTMTKSANIARWKENYPHQPPSKLLAQRMVPTGDRCC